MQRVPEPELMDDAEQALAYARADFEEPNRRFVEQFAETYPELTTGAVLDLGCGPGDIVLRLATRHPALVVHGLDGSAAMLHFASERLHEAPALGGRVQFIEGLLPGAALPLPAYDAVISNSLLHHLHEPRHFWRAVRDAALVERYSGGEPDLLKRDFFASLCAAFTPGEIRAQLAECGFAGFDVRPVSDRHVLVTGRLPAR
jgi:SAM-dependent methyltransferase